MNKDNKDNNIMSSPHVGDLLPGYIDSSLPEGELDAVRAHLEDCEACRAEYADLQATRAMLQQMPLALVPRSFAITEEVARRARKPSLLERIFTPRFAPTFAAGSVVAFVLLVFLFATNAGTPVSLSPISHISSGLMGDAPENTTMSDQSRVAPDATANAKQFSPSATSTALAGAESTTAALGAAPQPDVDTTTGGTAPGATAPPGLAYSADTSTEPGMTSYTGNYTTTPPVDFRQVVEAGLLALGVALAAAAVIARRRG